MDTIKFIILFYGDQPFRFCSSQARPRILEREVDVERIDVLVIRAFVTDGQGGNPAGVVLDADRLSDEAMQQVAARVGLSETAFASQSNVADVRLDFFTPTRRIPHCGHATIATFAHLAAVGRVSGPRSSKQTVDGIRRIRLDGDRAFMEQAPAEFSGLTEAGVSEAQVWQALRLPVPVPAGRPSEVVSTGNRFLVVEVDSDRELRGLQPDLEAVRNLSDRLDLVGFYVFTRHTRFSGRHAGARMFAPRFGIDEEAATGMAAGPLAALLRRRSGVERSPVLIEQGYAMPRPSPSLLEVRLELADEEPHAVFVGGAARLERTVTVPLDGVAVP